MYYSIIEKGRFYVCISDGVAEATIMELPTEELADEVALQLQLAWNEGESWGQNSVKKQVDPAGYHTEVSESIKKIKSMREEDQLKHFEVTSKQLEAKRELVKLQVLRRKR